MKTAGEIEQMGDVRQTITPSPLNPADFSLVLGGPLYQMWRRTHLSGDGLELLRRRGKGHVGKGKEEAPVNDPDAVQMPFFDSDDRGRRAVRAVLARCRGLPHQTGADRDQHRAAPAAEPEAVP